MQHAHDAYFFAGLKGIAKLCALCASVLQMGPRHSTTCSSRTRARCAWLHATTLFVESTLSRGPRTLFCTTRTMSAVSRIVNRPTPFKYIDVNNENTDSTLPGPSSLPLTPRPGVLSIPAGCSRALTSREQSSVLSCMCAISSAGSLENSRLSFLGTKNNNYLPFH